MHWRERISQSQFMATLSEPPWRYIVERLPVLGSRVKGWRRTHPIDRTLGIETSGFLPASMIQDAGQEGKLVKPYAACQPSVLRAALKLLPDVSDYTFVDLGCGKGRALAVAAEFPFKAIVGVELSERLAKVARANAAILAARHPERTAITIAVADAVQHDLGFPIGPRVVYFLYNPFTEDQQRAFTRVVTSRLGAPLEHVFVLYYNPVVGHVVDEFPELVRYAADTFDVDATEQDFGPVATDTVVMWQSLPARFPALASAGRAIVAPEGRGHAYVA